MSFLDRYKLVDLSPKLIPGKEERRLEIRRFIFELDNTIMHDVDTMTHIGSHIEAPLHYKDGLKDVTELPLESFIGEGVLLYFDFLDPGSPITPEAVNRAAEPDSVGEGDIVLMHSPYTGDRRPYIARETAKYLKETGIKMLGIGNTVQLEEKGEMFTHDNLLGNGPAIQRVRQLVRQVGPTDATVLIRGESGTGKELVARALHRASLRAEQPFVSVNCGSFSPGLLDSELFGHVRGAFTGAHAEKKGLFEVADNGTVFLDAIGELHEETQVRLLRVMEQREFMPVGGTETKKVDVRFIAATNRDLRAEVERGAFREDLYWRLNVISLRIPPLRERPQDILPLAKLFLERFAREMRRPVEGLTPEAEQLLVRYPWPGNVRELRNVMERAVILGGQGRIGPESLPPELRAGAPRGGGMGALQEMERRMIEEALRRAGGNKSEAARLLGVSRDLLRYRMRKYGIRG